MIADEARLFGFAVQFLTRLPVPAFDTRPADWLARSVKYMPLVGALIGAVAGIAAIATAAVFPNPISVVVALGVAIVITGALHEDGLADVADAFGGKQSRERTLEILKDSRIGTYGTLALIVALGLKGAALASMDVVSMARVLIAAHAGARMAAVFAIATLPHAGSDAKVSTPEGTLTTKEIATAAVLGLLPGFLMLQFWTFAVATVFAVVGAALMGVVARRRIGGYTGDVLGAIEQVYEVVFLMFAASVISGPG